MRDGAYCLDRDPEVFKVVLGYLRCGELVTTDLSEGMMRKLKIECDFFNLKGLRNLVQVVYPEVDDLLELDVRGTRFTKTRAFLMKYQDDPTSHFLKCLAKLFNLKSEIYIQ